MKTIWFDAFWWVSGPPSGRNVVQSLIQTWATQFPEDKLVVVVPLKDCAVVRAALQEFSRIEVRGTWLPQHGLFNLVGRLGHSDIDLVIRQNFGGLFTSARQIVFYHDALAQDRPEWFSWKERIYMRLASLSLRCANVVATSSRAEANRIGRMNRKLQTPIVDVGLGLPTSFRTSDPRRPEIDVNEQGYLLTVGRLNVRKNIGQLIYALRNAKIINSDFPLVVVGSADGLNDERLSNIESDDDIIWTGYIEDQELKWLYMNAKAFIFPSLDEGFGLPVLEAASVGTPMALSSIPAFKEFSNIGHFFDPLNCSSIAEAVQKVIDSPIAPDTFEQQFSWERTVNDLREATSAIGGTE